MGPLVSGTILPRLIYITDRKALPSSTRLRDIIERSLQASVDGIYLREKDLSEVEYRDLVEEIIPLVHRYHARLIVPYGHHELDLSDFFVQCGQSTPLAEAKRLAMEVESLAELRHGPVFAITEHLIRNCFTFHYSCRKVRPNRPTCPPPKKS